MVRSLHSVSVPITLGFIALALSIALLVGWTLLLVQGRWWTGSTLILVLGIVSFAVIMIVLILFSVFLARANIEKRQQTDFIDSVTHELKSPLASLRLCAETLARPELQNSQRESLRQMMLDDIDRLTVFIDDVLQASRIAQRLPAQEPGEVPLLEFARECVGSIITRHRLSPEVITLNIDPTVTLRIDPTALSVILRNLLDNAVKYSDGEPSIEMRAYLDGAYFWLTIRDHGIGLPSLETRQIFQRFYRVESEAVRSRQGTGLGLYVVSSLVRGLGGRVKAHSEGIDRGTQIEIRLPSSLLR